MKRKKENDTRKEYQTVSPPVPPGSSTCSYVYIKVHVYFLMAKNALIRIKSPCQSHTAQVYIKFCVHVVKQRQTGRPANVDRVNTKVIISAKSEPAAAQHGWEQRHHFR